MGLIPSLLDCRERTDEGWWWCRRGDDEAELATGGPPEAEAAEAPPAAAPEIDGPAPPGVEHDDALENTNTFYSKNVLSISWCYSWILK